MSSATSTTKTTTAAKARKIQENKQHEQLLLQTQHTPIAKKTRIKIKASQTTKSTIINLEIDQVEFIDTGKSKKFINYILCM